jgi:hypothetical protein
MRLSCNGLHRVAPRGGPLQESFFMEESKPIWAHVSNPVLDLCLRAALKPRRKSTQKERLMVLYEHGLLSGSELRALIVAHGLEAA